MKPKLNKLETLEFIMQVFGKRILPGLLFSSNHELFLKWQGNICKQAAVIGSFVIQNHLPEGYVKVEAWEGFFNHEKLGDYNHCWNYIIHESDPKLNIICDFTSTISYFDYCEHNDPTLHIGGTQNAVVKHKIELTGMQEIDIEKEFSQPEFYTGASGEEIKRATMSLLQQAKLWNYEESSLV